MKKLITFLTFTFIFTACTKDEIATTSPGIEWINPFVSEIEYGFYSNNPLAHSADGFLLATNGYLIACNNQGDSINGFHFQNEIYDIRETTDGYLLLGKNDANDYNWFLETDSDLNNQVEYTFSTPEISRPSSIVKVNDGFVVGSVSHTATNKNSWVTKLDSDGNESWQFAIEKDSFDESIKAIEVADNGDLLIISTQSREKDIYSNCWVTRLSANGDLIWETTFPEKDYGEYAIDIIKRDEGDYFVVTSYFLNSSIYQINEDGVIVKEKKFNNTTYGEFKKANDGNFITAGSFLYQTVGPFSDNYSYPVITKINSSGENIWEMYLNINNADSGNGLGIAVTGDGGYVSISSSYYGGYELFKVKPD